MKALIVSTLGRQFFLFEAANMSALKKLGVEVHGAANLEDEDQQRLDSVDIIKHHIGFRRSPVSPRNVLAFIRLLRLIRRERYTLVHCHSPVAGVLGRVAAHIAGVPRIIYTAHGFHFFKGATATARMVYFPIEWISSLVTDLILTVNGEDSAAAGRMHAKAVVQIPGVGVDVASFAHSQSARVMIRRELDIPLDAKVVLSVGEMIPRKDHSTALYGLAAMTSGTAHMILCGKGQEEMALKELVKDLEIENRIHFVGYRSDVAEICSAADVFVSTSRQEGLPVSCIEAMAAGLPVICTNVRGHVDLVQDQGNGLLFDVGDNVSLAKHLDRVLSDRELSDALRARALKRAGEFESKRVEELMTDVYTELVSGAPNR